MDSDLSDGREFRNIEEGENPTEDQNWLIWERRLVLMSAFGLVGLGALVGTCNVYIRYIKLRVAQHIAIHSFAGHLQRQNELSTDEEAGSLHDAENDSAGDVPKVDKSVETFEGFKGQARISSIGSAGGRNSKKSVEVTTDEAENVEFFFANIDELLDGPSADQHEAYTKLKSTGDKLKNVCDYWWRMARASHTEAQMAEQRQDKDAQKAFLINAFSYAERALKLNDRSADAHKWFAITSGSRGEFLKINERIQSGYVFKEHIDKALELNPSDSSLHHLLGRFCYEVSQLSWVERRVAATLFSNPPTATVQEALHHFLEAEKGKPLIDNHLFLARCYISLNEPKKAAQWLQSGSRLSAVSAGDKKAQNTVNELMGKYKKYL